MKNFRILAFLLIIMVASCDRDEAPARMFSLDRVCFSDCKNEKSAMLDGAESLVYRYEKGDLLYFMHKNIVFNCCQPANNLTVVPSLVGDSIIINEFEKEMGLCKCVCPYDMECAFGPLKEKQYWIIVKKGDVETYRFPILFSKELEGVKSF